MKRISFIGPDVGLTETSSNVQISGLEFLKFCFFHGRKISTKYSSFLFKMRQNYPNFEYCEPICFARDDLQAMKDDADVFEMQLENNEPVEVLINYEIDLIDFESGELIDIKPKRYERFDERPRKVVLQPYDTFGDVRQKLIEKTGIRNEPIRALGYLHFL